MQKKKQQHTIPEGSLKNFRDPYLWRADLEKKDVKQISLEKASVIFWYYTPGNVAPEHKNVIEDFFDQQVEEPAIRVFDALVRGDVDADRLSEEQRVAICAFMAFQKTRVPSFRNMVEDMYKQVGEHTIAQITADAEKFRGLMLDYQKATGKEIGDIEDQRDFMRNRSTIKTNPDVSLRAALEQALKLIAMLHAMHWKFLRSSQASFLTTDNPVVWHNPEATLIFGHGLAMPTIELTFPIGRQLCLYATWDKKDFDGKNIPKRVVQKLNERHIGWATRYAFSGSEKLANWAVETSKSLGK